MAKVIKNITALAYIEARLLHNITVAGHIAILKFWRNWQDLPTSGLSELVITSEVENKSRKFTTKLTAHLTEHFDVADRNLCFLATAVDGSRYLVGTADKPFPIVNTEDTMPGSVTAKSGCTLTVELTDLNGLLEVVD